MPKRLILLLSIFIFGFYSFALAKTSIKASVDKLVMTTDEALVYKVIVSSDEKKVTRPELPKIEDFSVVSQVQSTSIQFSGKGVTNSEVYVFVLAPIKTGQLEIKPSALKINGKALSTESFKITVKQGKNKPQLKPVPKSGTNQKPFLPENLSPEKDQTTL